MARVGRFQRENQRHTTTRPLSLQIAPQNFLAWLCVRCIFLLAEIANLIGTEQSK